MDEAFLPLGHLVDRHVAGIVEEALADTRVVLINGARQTGKSTLVRTLVANRPSTLERRLDLPDVRQAAEEDPVDFVRHDGLLVIDEVQRVPELMLAIKDTVDLDPRPGRFLLTGSARVLALRGLPDALPGRMEVITLWPFSQGEVDGSPSRFVDAAFDAGTRLEADSTLTKADYVELVARGGYPEAVARTDQKRRQRFFTAYLNTMIDRDVRELSAIEYAARIRQLIRLLAARSGQLLVLEALARELGVSAPTVRHYIDLLEQVFLICRIPAWSGNLSTRVVGTPKVVLADSGLAAGLVGQDTHRLLAPDSALGPLLEGFVVMELMKQITWSDTMVELFHFRTKDQVEVDAVLESADGRVIGIEVKAAATVRAEDFRGLRYLADRLKDRFFAGYLLYSGPHTLPFGPKFRAMPISALWSVRP